MKQITIVIPTRDRIKKLKKTIESIPFEWWIDILIVCDGDRNSYNTIKSWHDQQIDVRLVEENKGAVYCRNSVMQEIKDGVLYATDDIIFEPNSIENAFNAFNAHFPDDDGVVGLVITKVPNYHLTGVALVGKKFLDRYPNRELFYPGYFHFSCQEVYWLAKKYGKFHQEKTAVVQHYHPSFHKEEMDETHREARIHKARDMALIKERQAKGLIWGDQ